MSIGYQGEPHSYSHQAAGELFPGEERVGFPSFPAAFEAFAAGRVARLVVPIENSTDGGIVDTLDCLTSSPVQICGEVPLAIHHCLLGQGAREDVQTIYSKPQALSQCRNWLSKHMPSVQLTAVGSTAEAARRALADAG